MAEGDGDAADDAVADPVGLTAWDALCEGNALALAVFAALAVWDPEVVLDDDGVGNPEPVRLIDRVALARCVPVPVDVSDIDREIEAV